MTANCPRVRTVRCDTCGSRRYNLCRNAAGERVQWHHAARLSLADGPAKGRPQRPITPEVRQDIADGVPLAEVERRHGISRTVLYRRGLMPVRRPPVSIGDVPPEVPGWLAEGVSLSEIARRTGMSRSALGRRGVGASGRGRAA